MCSSECEPHVSAFECLSVSFCFMRYRLDSTFEMQENLRIMRAPTKITPGPFKVDEHKLVPPLRTMMNHLMVSSFPFPLILNI